MNKKTVGLSDAFKGNTAPKSFTKNPIKGTKFTIAISSAKGGVGKSTFAMNFALALKFIGLKYAAEGDTMGMLVAVLNSNFWLAIHVTTITIGYGVSLVAGLMGHIYLIYAAIKPNDKKELTKINEKCKT